MARFLIVGSIARDEVVRLRTALRAGGHLEGIPSGARLGGGAACTAVPLAHAGHQVTVVSAVGTDPAGDWLLARLVAMGVDVSQVCRVEGESTRSIVMVDETGERTIVNLVRAQESEPPRRVLDLPADCLYVRSRAPGLAPILSEKARSCLVVAHIPPCDEGARPAQVLVASEYDLDPASRAEPWKTGRHVAGDRLEWVVLTHGPEGAEAFGAEARLRAAAKAVRARDTTGSGDAFAAGLIHALVAGGSMRAALETGVAWGAESARSLSSVLPAEAVARLLASPIGPATGTPDV